MASDADKLKERLRQEMSKPIPNQDVIYAIEKTLPYANSVDTERVRRGLRAL